MSQRTFYAFCGDAVPPRACARNDAEIEAVVRESAGSTYHPSGTCRMREHPMSVVDSQCRGHGMKGLRVDDSAIMPSIVSEKFNAPPTMMMGEKRIRHDPRPDPASATNCIQPVDLTTF